MISQYLRRRNLTLERFVSPLATASSGNRGVINEAGFRLYGISRERKKTVASLGDQELVAAVDEAVRFIRRFRASAEEELIQPSEEGMAEAFQLAARLEQFVDLMAPAMVAVSPPFAGCGWVDECYGDLVMDNMLCEVKAGDSTFQGRDIRQVLIYAALNSVSEQYDIDEVCLLNTRRGVYLREPLEHLCAVASGGAGENVLSDIVSYVSQVEWRDESI